MKNPLNQLEEQRGKNELDLQNNINTNLNSIQEEEKDINKELQDNNSEDENLGYNSNYNIKKKWFI